MGLYNGKTTTTLSILYYAVTQNKSTGKHQDLEQPVIMKNIQGVCQKKLTDNEIYFPF